MPVTHYQLLGILDNASLEEITAAYKEQARIWHSDKAITWAPKDQLLWCIQVFTRINTAYEELKDPSKRRAYDTIRKFLVDDLYEKEFEIKWNSLKKAYAAYLKEKNNPQATIDDLKLQLANALAENKLLTAKLEKQTQQVSHLTLENSSRIKRILELERENSELQSKLISQYQSTNTTQVKSETNYKIQPQPAFKTNTFFNNNTNNAVSYNTSQPTSEKIPSKIPAQGLEIIYKVFHRNPYFHETYNFHSLALIFDNKTNADKFRRNWKYYVKQSSENSFYFSLSSVKEDPVKDKEILCACFNDNALFHNKFNRSSTTMLDELVKYAEIKGIKVESRLYQQNIGYSITDGYREVDENNYFHINRPF